MQILGTINWNNKTLKVAKSFYTDRWKRPALILLCSETNEAEQEWEDEQYSVASVNLADEPRLDPNEVFIKNWNENEGVLQALVEAGIVEDTGHTIPTGYVKANVCTLIAGTDEDDAPNAPNA
jgi:hypothetical protein